MAKFRTNLVTLYTGLKYLSLKRCGTFHRLTPYFRTRSRNLLTSACRCLRARKDWDYTGQSACTIPSQCRPLMRTDHPSSRPEACSCRPRWCASCIRWTPFGRRCPRQTCSRAQWRSRGSASFRPFRCRWTGWRSSWTWRTRASATCRRWRSEIIFCLRLSEFENISCVKAVMIQRS